MSKIIKVCKKHGELSKDGCYYNKSTNGFNCKVCRNASTLKYRLNNKKKYNEYMRNRRKSEKSIAYEKARSYLSRNKKSLLMKLYKKGLYKEIINLKLTTELPKPKTKDELNFIKIRRREYNNAYNHVRRYGDHEPIKKWKEKYGYLTPAQKLAKQSKDLKKLLTSVYS